MQPSEPPSERNHGRPPANPSSPRFWETKLHKLLAGRLDHIDGIVVSDRIVPSRLAAECGVCRFTAYRWLNEDNISPKGAKKIIGVSGGRLTKEDFAPFLIL